MSTLPALVTAMMHGGRTMPMADWWGWAMMAFVLLVWLLVVAAVVGGIVLLVRALRGSNEGQARRASSSALAILEERFARGEIDREEFEERRRALEG